ncbi:hypothetical protein B484DRAFT_435162, partial [Ochromonadaceae sp. CCMP2298]
MSTKRKALFDYVAQDDNQISFRKGDILAMSSSVSDTGGWSCAEEPGTGKVGFFPTDYAELVKSTPPPRQRPTAPKAASLKTKVFAKAMFEFDGAGANEMKLVVGQVLEVLERGEPRGWTKGLQGSFPTDYVMFLLDGLDAKKEEKPPASVIPTAAMEPKMETKKEVEKPAPPPSSSTLPAVTAASVEPTKDTKEAAKTPPPPSATPAPLEPQAQPTPLPPSAIPPPPAIIPTVTASVVPTTKPAPPENTLTTASLDSAMAGLGMGVTTDTLTADTLTDTTDPSPYPDAESTTRSKVSDVPQTKVTDNSRNSAIASNLSAAPSKQNESIFVEVIHAREAASATELTIKEGDRILVISQDGDWWYGSTMDALNSTGYFPHNYVQIVADKPAVTGVKAPPPAYTAAMPDFNRPSVRASTNLSKRDARVNWSEVGAGLSGNRFAFEALRC